MDFASCVLVVPSSAEATTAVMVLFRKSTSSSVTPLSFLVIVTCMGLAGVVVTRVVVVVGVVVVAGVMVVVVVGILEYAFQISQ